MVIKPLAEQEPLYSHKAIKVEVPARRLYLEQGNKPVSNYPIAVGTPDNPTPPGTYRIVQKIVNPGDGLGTRWLGLDIPDGPYGIHGTWDLSSIGTAASHGCIRMFNEDVEQLFSLVKIGTTVVIINPTYS